VTEEIVKLYRVFFQRRRHRGARLPGRHNSPSTCFLSHTLPVFHKLPLLRFAEYCYNPSAK
jgi:hypothetical protein